MLFSRGFTQFFHLRSFQSLMEEKVALSYFQVMDVDGDGKLSENDLLVISAGMSHFRSFSTRCIS